MKQKELIKKLEDISTELDCIPHDSSLASAARDILKVKDMVDELAEFLEDNDIKKSDEKDEEENGED